MAATEVTVASPGDAGMLKDEEAEPSDKTPVILNMPPILHGINDVIADTGTTVLAIETHHDDNDIEGDEVEYGYPITCGDSRAVLLFKKFVCPGINVRCVKFNEQLISPKQFVHLAGKATLKDWKRAIRLGGVMLRKMMDSGQIDFYQHDAVCTNTCRSTKFDLMINSSRLPSTVLPGPSSLSAAEPAGGQLAPMAGGEVVKVDHPPEEKVSVTEEWSRGPPPPTSTNGHVNKKKRPDMPAGMLGLWQGVAEEGLMGGVLSSIHTELLSALRGVESRADRSSLNHTDAFIMNSLCETFGLLDSVKRALERRRTHCEDTTTHTKHFYVLEESMGEQKEKDYYGESRSHREQKEKDYYGESRSHREQKEKDYYGESRSHREQKEKDYYDESRSHREQKEEGYYGESRSNKAVSSKRPRLHRHSAPTGQTQNLTQHGSGPLVQPLTVAGLATASQAELTASPQRYGHRPASGSAQAGRDGHSATLEAWDRLHRLGRERGEVEVDSGTRGSREDDPDPRRSRHEGPQNEYLLVSEPAVRGKKVSEKHKTNGQPAQKK